MMANMSNQCWIKPLLIAVLLCCAALLSAADVEPAPAPWHVENAELCVPVKVEVTAALLRILPQGDWTSKRGKLHSLLLFNPALL